MNPVFQRSRWDCGICAAAMVFDIAYEEIEAALPYRCGDDIPGAAGSVFGVTGADVMWLALGRGELVTQVIPREIYIEHSLIPGPQHALIPFRDGLWDWLIGRRAWLCVPALTGPHANGTAKHHAIAWDGQSVVDPVAQAYPALRYRPDDRPDFFEAVVRLDPASGAEPLA